VQRELGVNDAELDDDAHAKGDLVGGEDFLAFDCKVALAQVHEIDFHAGFGRPENPAFERNLVTAGFKGFGQHTVLVPQPAMCVLDDNLEFGSAHGAAPVSDLVPRSEADV